MRERACERERENTTVYHRKLRVVKSNIKRERATQGMRESSLALSPNKLKISNLLFLFVAS